MSISVGGKQRVLVLSVPVCGWRRREECKGGEQPSTGSYEKMMDDGAGGEDCFTAPN